MSELFLKQDDEEFVFVHCFLILEWNLMARSESVVVAHVENISWSNGALVFKFEKMKDDQTGLNADQEWHVYATLTSQLLVQSLLLLYIYMSS